MATELPCTAFTWRPRRSISARSRNQHLAAPRCRSCARTWRGRLLSDLRLCPRGRWPRPPLVRLSRDTDSPSPAPYPDRHPGRRYHRKSGLRLFVHDSGAIQNKYRNWLDQIDLLIIFTALHRFPNACQVPTRIVSQRPGRHHPALSTRMQPWLKSRRTWAKSCCAGVLQEML